MHIRSRIDTAYIFFLFTVLVVVLAYVLIRLYLDITSGGHLWRQADWLINNQYHFVRRGIFGSLLFSISDYFSLDPLIFLGFIQGTIIIIVCSTFIISVAQLRPNTRVLWITLSPAFILMFWLFDFHGTYRKELLVYFSYSVLLCGIIVKLRSYIVMWLSSLSFVFAVFAHEGNFFFLPFFILALFVFNNDLQNKKLYILLVFVIASLLGGLGYAIAFSQPTDPNFVCQALLERGLSDTLCDGAIAFLDRDRAIHVVKKQLLHSGLYVYYVIAYILSIVPLFFLRPAILSRTIYCAFICIGIMAFFPLFILAYDWGRWINFYVTSISFVLIMHMILNRDLYPLNINNPPALKVFAFLHCFLWSMPHCCNPIGFGIPGFIDWLVNCSLISECSESMLR